MNEAHDLRLQVESLQRRNEEVARQLADAQQAIQALTHGEVDAVAIQSSITPVLLHAAQEDLRRNESLPRTSGRALAEELAPQRPAMKVLFMSGYTDDAVVRHGVLDAGVAFLQRPFTPDLLLRRLGEALATNPPERADG